MEPPPSPRSTSSHHSTSSNELRTPSATEKSTSSSHSKDGKLKVREKVKERRKNAKKGKSTSGSAFQPSPSIALRIASNRPGSSRSTSKSLKRSSSSHSVHSSSAKSHATSLPNSTSLLAPLTSQPLSTAKLSSPMSSVDLYHSSSPKSSSPKSEIKINAMKKPPYSQPLQWAQRAAYQNSVSLEETEEFTFEDASDDEAKAAANVAEMADRASKKDDTGNIFTHSPHGKGFIDFFASSQFADVKLILREGPVFLAHQLILAYSSGYFYELFVSSRGESKPRERTRKISSKTTKGRVETAKRSKLAKIVGDDAGSDDDDELIVVKKTGKEETKKEKKNGGQKSDGDLLDSNSRGSNLLRNLRKEKLEAWISATKLSEVDSSLGNSELDESSEFSLSSSLASNDSLVLTTSTESCLRNDVLRDIYLEFEHPASEFRAVLEYMYRGSVDVTAKNCVSLMAVARMYRIVPLQKLIRDFFRINLQRETAIQLLCDSMAYGAIVSDMIEACINMTARNFCYLYDVDYSILDFSVFLRIVQHKKLAIRDEFALYTIVCDYVAKKGSLLTDEQKSELLSHVRYRFCTYAELESVAQNPLVPAPFLVEALMARLKPYELEKESNSGDKNRPFQRPHGATKSAMTTLSVSVRPLSPFFSSATAPQSPTSGASSSLLSNNLASSLPLPATAKGTPMSSRSPASSPSTSRAKSLEKESRAQHDLLESRVDEDDLFVKTALDESTTLDGDEQALPLRLRPRPKFDVVFDFYPGTAFFKGVIGWIATNYGRSDWKNPHLSGRVKVHCSSLLKGSRAALLDTSPAECWTSDVPSSWMSIDFGPHRRITPTYYSLRHGGNYRADALRTWDLQGSTDGASWKTINRHTNNPALNGPYATASFAVTGLQPRESFRLFRILQTGHNSSNRNFLVLSGLEFYGVLHDN